MNDHDSKRESGLSDMAHRALDAILNRGHEHEQAAPTPPASQPKQNASDGDGDGGVSIGEKAGATPASSTSGGSGPWGAPAPAADTHPTSSAADSIASGGLSGAAGALAANQSDASPSAPMGGGDPGEDEFVGSGGVGSAEFMEALRKGHEAAGGEYTSDLGDPNRSGPTEA
ncbi:MAG TPA: hypothetical protein VM409_01545 [Chloroflexia bacterium]|nr:hypothetical protein [Chloroflexia bacterium]